MLGWFLIAWVTYFHSTFISPYLEDGFEDYRYRPCICSHHFLKRHVVDSGCCANSPFDDIYETHHTPTLPLALEELAEALVWTGAGMRGQISSWFILSLMQRLLSIAIGTRQVSCT